MKIHPIQSGSAAVVPRSAGRRPLRWWSLSMVIASGMLVLIFLLSACAPASVTSTGPAQTPTAVIAGEIPIQLPAAAQHEATSRPTIAPFRFVLPTPGAEPVLGWRPPLYPVPWAVSAYDHFYFARPIAADNVNWPLAEYRYGGVFFANTVHTGVDIDANEGAEILAAGPGTVISADWGLYSGAAGSISDPYGKAVVVRHDFGYKGQALFTIYAHMSEILVSEGDTVDAGDVIGRVGATGRVTGPHLHWLANYGSVSVDPLGLIELEQGRGPEGGKASLPSPSRPKPACHPERAR